MNTSMVEITSAPGSCWKAAAER